MNRIELRGGNPARIDDRVRQVIEVFAGDLPCPWCGEATAEADAACGGCGRKFG